MIDYVKKKSITAALAISSIVLKSNKTAQFIEYMIRKNRLVD